MASQKKLTESFKRLRKNLNRAETLLKKFFDQPGGMPRRRGQPQAHEQELLRSVLVLAIGALDAFLSELLVELMPRIAEESTDAAVFERIAKDNPGLILRSLFRGLWEHNEALSCAIQSHFPA